MSFINDILAKYAEHGKPKQFGTYDFETYDWTKPLCADAFYDGEHEYNINRENSTEVVRSLLFAMESSGCAEWWAHNGGKYDALFVVECIRQLKGWKCDGAVAAGRIINLRVMSPNATFTLKDSFAVIQSSLDKALLSFEIPHKKVFTKAEYARLDTNKPCEWCEGVTPCNHRVLSKWSMRDFSDDKLRRGCQADTEALHALICKAQDLFNEWGGELKSTFSASALSVVKSQLGKPLPSHDGNQWANDIGKKTYAGGRVEVFRHLPAPLLNEYDVTSSYPWSMSQPLPWNLLGWDKPELFNKRKLQLVYARVSVPYQYVPPLPFVPPKGGLFFPWGEWSGWFTSAELEYAMQECGVTAELFEAVSYSVDQPFQTFIDKVFKEKQQATGARREFCKLVLNGCYGKFAQKPENTKLLMFDTAEAGLLWARDNVDREPEPLNASNTAWSMKTFRWPAQTHYALASFITAYSRILLHNHLTWASNGAEGGYLAYCDTDSIHCDAKRPWDPRVINDKLGGLKVEMTAYQGRFYAPKLYELHPTHNGHGEEAEFYRPPNKDDRYKPEAHYASKGFPVDAASFARIVKGESVGNPKGRMQLLKTQLRKDSGVRHLEESETEKAWSGRSNKRFVIPGDPEGNTKPWHVRELYEGLHIEQQSPLAPRVTQRPKKRRR